MVIHQKAKFDEFVKGEFIMCLVFSITNYPDTGKTRSSGPFSIKSRIFFNTSDMATAPN